MPDAQGSKTAGVPQLPVTRDTPQIENYQPLGSPGDTDEFIRKSTAISPELAALAAAPDSPARVALMGGMTWQTRQSVYAFLITLVFQYQKRSLYAEALKMARIRLEIAESETDGAIESFFGHTRVRNLGDAHHDIGSVQEHMGDYSLALASYLDAEELYGQDETIRNQTGITKPCEFDRIFHQEDFRSLNFAAISAIYKRFGDEKAALYNEKAWRYSKRGADEDGHFRSLIASAEGAKEGGDLDAALGSYWEALDLALRSSLSKITAKDVVIALGGAASIYQQFGLGRRALEMLRRSLELNQRNGHLGRQCADYTHIAEIHALRGEFDAAVEAYGQALRCCAVEVPESAVAGSQALIWNDGGKRLQLVQLESAWRILLAKGRILRHRSEGGARECLALAVEALESLRVRIIEESNRLSYQASAVDLYDEIIDLFAETYERTCEPGILAELFSYIERAKARVLAELLADQPVRKPLDTPVELIKQEMALIAKIGELQGSLEGAGSSLKIVDEIKKSKLELEATWEAIAKSDPREGPAYVSLRKAEPASAADVQTLLRAADRRRVALVSYYFARNRLISVCVFSDHAEMHYHSERVDRNQAREWALVKPDDPPAIDLRLPYWLLDFPGITVQPIADAIEGYEVVCFAPHDLLHSLPLHAFAAQEGHQPIIGTTTICYIPSASLLRFSLNKPGANSGESLVAGNPTRPDEAPIPQSASEAEAVAAILGTRALTGSAATRNSIEGKCGDAQYIHLACHCKFSRTDPLDSGLLLSDGNLTARDILGWRIGPDVCVLSACQSGISENRAGDELIGLVRALFFAGASSVVVSLWNAYDAATSEIMREFYSGRIGDRKTKASALADALRSQVRKGTPAALWAPFVLIGDWR